ncbi:ATP-grasp domain-containing protein [Actinoplanes sp. NPDC026619]|uniref:carboxylate--amine ligase n=1 Tax=Actinoplanes sp. NPDC026619 TaxID=3155798 RepID=UPI0033DFD3BA
MRSPGAVVLGGDYQGLGIVRSLGEHGIPTVVVDDERSIAAASRWTGASVRVPSLRSDTDVLDALSLARARFGDLDGWVVFPTRDENVAALSRHRSLLARSWRIPAPPWDCVRTAWDKRETYRMAQKLGVASPRTWFPLSVADLDEVDLSAPVIIKPAIKENFFYATRAKAWRADSLPSLRRQFTRAAEIVPAGEILVQEMIPGDGQFSYCAFVRDGAAVASMTVRRTRQHPSDFGRASTFVQTVPLPALEAPSLTFLREIGYYGLVEVEFKLDPRDGEFKLLDVNARTWGYHSLGRAAGVDFPYLLFRDQIGRPVPPGVARSGVSWIRLATDVPNAVVDRARPAPYLRTLRGIDTEAVFSRRDPLPGLYELALLPYLAVKRGL